MRQRTDRRGFLAALGVGAIAALGAKLASVTPVAPMFTFQSSDNFGNSVDWREVLATNTQRADELSAAIHELNARHADALSATLRDFERRA